MRDRRSDGRPNRTGPGDGDDRAVPARGRVGPHRGRSGTAEAAAPTHRSASAVAEDDRRHRVALGDGRARRRAAGLSVALSLAGTTRSVRHGADASDRRPPDRMAELARSRGERDRLDVGVGPARPRHDGGHGVLPALPPPHRVPREPGRAPVRVGDVERPVDEGSAVQRDADRRLAGILVPRAPDRSPHGPADRHHVHARPPRPAALAREGRDRCDRRDRGRPPDLPRGRAPDGPGLRGDPRCGHPDRVVPRLRPQRRLPRALRPARQGRPSGRGRSPGRGDPVGDAGPARVDDPRDKAGGARGVGRLDADEAPRRRRAGRSAIGVREALREEPRPRGPLVQARSNDVLRQPRRRDAVPDRPAVSSSTRTTRCACWASTASQRRHHSASSRSPPSAST